MPDDVPQSAEALEPPTSNGGDVALAIIKGVVQAFPFVGGLGSEVLALVVKAPLQKRQEYWMRAVGVAIRELSEKTGRSFENLGNDEQFISAVLHATQAALRSHQEEKLTALRNAVVNSAFSKTDSDLQLMFLGFIDSFGQTHIRVLKFAQDPARWLQAQHLSRWLHHKGPHLVEGWDKIEPLHQQFLRAILPDVKQRYEFYTQIIQDLMDSGLIRKGIGFEIGHLDATPESISITELGNAFLRFIDPPDSSLLIK